MVKVIGDRQCLPCVADSAGRQRAPAGRKRTSRRPPTGARAWVLTSPIDCWVYWVAGLSCNLTTNACKSGKSDVLYPPKVGQKLSIGFIGESGESRLIAVHSKSRVWAEVKDAGDAAWGRRPRPEHFSTHELMSSVSTWARQYSYS